MPDPGELNPSAWKDVNEALEAQIGPPPDPVQDGPPPGAAPHGTSGPKLIQGKGYDTVGMDETTEPYTAPKLEDNGVRYQMVTARDAAQLAAEERLKKLQAEVEQRNRDIAAQAHPAFTRDGSLAGEYAPLGGEATTPDTVDAIWWLGLPKAQAIWELGLNNEEEYARVHRDVEAVAYQVENRRRQMMQNGLEPDFVPMVIKRRKRRVNSALFHGGKVTRIKPMTDPNKYPKPKRLPD